MDEGAQPAEAVVPPAPAAAAAAGDDGDEEDLLKQALAMSMADGEEFENMRVQITTLFYFFRLSPRPLR